MQQTLLTFCLILASFCLLAADPEIAEPESVGMSSEQLARIKPSLQQYVDAGQIPGITTLVARHGKIVHLESTGVLNLDTGEPLKSDSLFRIYSMTKPIVTAASMILYDEGKFDLDDPVQKYLPEFKDTMVLEDGKQVSQEHPFTVRELMSHTAGLTYGFFSDTPVDKLYQQAGILRQENLQQMVAALADIPLLNQPGTQWHYSVAVDVLGRLIEVISGQPLDEYLSEHMFEPLDMEDTFFQVPEDKIGRFGTNHRLDDKAEKQQMQIVDSPENSKFTGDVTFFSGGGGLVSTAMDYYRFNQMMLNMGELNGVRILKPETVVLITRNHIGKDDSSGSGENPGTTREFGFGLGYQVSTQEPALFGSKGEYNWGGAAGTIFWNDPKENLTAILMVQVMGNNKPLRQHFRRLVYTAIQE